MALFPVKSTAQPVLFMRDKCPKRKPKEPFSSRGFRKTDGWSECYVMVCPRRDACRNAEGECMSLYLNSRERKVLIVGGLALLVAIVTYGFLMSTGTFNDDLWSLGGAIVGFLSALAGLNKVYGQAEEGVPPGELREADFVSLETLKIVDLRDRVEVPEENRMTAPRSRVVIIDQHLLKKLTEKGSITFHCATTGWGIEGESISFPRDYVWENLTAHEATPG